MAYDDLKDKGDRQSQPVIRRPPGYRLPQKTLEATLRRGKRGWYMTFSLPEFGLLELTCIVAVPELVDGAKAPAYLRFFVDATREDVPGTKVIE